MKKRILLGSAAIVAAFALVIPQVKSANAQMNNTKDSPVYSGVLVKDQGNGDIYRITVKNGQLVTSKVNRNYVEAK